MTQNLWVHGKVVKTETKAQSTILCSCYFLCFGAEESTSNGSNEYMYTKI